jgi:hypothetical protein
MSILSQSSRTTVRLEDGAMLLICVFPVCRRAVAAAMLNNK